MAIAAEAMRIEAQDFHEGQVVFNEAGVKVTAFAVNHGDLIKPSVGYRVNNDSRSVTISGDTNSTKIGSSTRRGPIS
jgi:ribonuclease Z